MQPIIVKEPCKYLPVTETMNYYFSKDSTLKALQNTLPFCRWLLHRVLQGHCMFIFLCEKFSTDYFTFILPEIRGFAFLCRTLYCEVSQYRVVTDLIDECSNLPFILRLPLKNDFAVLLLLNI